MDWLTAKQAKRRTEAAESISKHILSECSPVLILDTVSQDMKKQKQYISPQETISTTTQQEAPDSNIQDSIGHSRNNRISKHSPRKKRSTNRMREEQTDDDLDYLTAALPCVSPATRTVRFQDHLDQDLDGNFSQSLAYPTEERNLQKAREKVRKEKGIKPKKKPKIIENHFDDCGADLSGLGIDPEEFVEQSTGHLAYSLMSSEVSLSDLDMFLSKVSEVESSLDIVEICGGTARTSVIAIRKGLVAGDNFDLVCSCDLNSPINQQKVLSYIKEHRPLIVVMAPTCTPFGPMSHLVRRMSPEAWQRSLKQARPHGRFCGRVAKEVDQLGIFFLAEQPFPSELWNEPEWKVVFARPNTKSILIHQCAAGQKGPNGGPAKKPTTFVSNSTIVLSHLTKFVCPGTHEHELLEGGKAKFCQVWPWPLANAIVDGILELKQSFVYPTVEGTTQTGSAGPARDDEDPFRKCPGCRGRVSKSDARHTCIRGECRWPDEETVSWDCIGCQRHRPASHDSHTYGPDCKHAIIPHRKGVPRTGRHPRQPMERTRDVPGREAQAQLPDDSDLLPADPSAAAASAPPPASSSDRPGRGPDLVERERRTYREAGVGDPHPSDWTRYDITHCLRALRSNHEPTVLKALRKIHLRLWHAGVSNMQSILRNAGVPQSVLDLIPNIIATCKECRMWAARPRETKPAVEIAMSFGEVVETDLMFYKEFIIHHFVCRASRWHAAIETPNKTEAQLLENISTAWISIFGPMQTLVTDPESGLNTATAEAHLKRLGVILKVRGKEQHARYVERRGAILRQALHVMDSQAVREGIDLTFKDLLGQCVFCGNSLTHVGGTTPYHVVLGRQPSMLPPITDDPGMNDRIEARIREIALQSMISATSAARVTRALKVPTTLTAEDRFKVDDLVELYRTPTNKDSSGWSGPYQVVESRAHDGVIVLRINGINRPYRIQDVRHAMFAVTLYGVAHPDNSKRALDTIHAFLNFLAERRTELFGIIEDAWGKIVVTQASRKWPSVAHALNYIIRTSFQMFDVCSARVGRNITKLPGQSGPQINIVFNWDMQNPDHMSLYQSDHAKVHISKVFGEQQPHFAVMQCFRLDHTHDFSLEDVVDTLPIREPAETDEHRAPSGHGSPASRLSTIQEENTNSQVSSEAEVLFLQHFDGAPKEYSQLLLELCEIAIKEDPETQYLDEFSFESPFPPVEQETNPFDFEVHLALSEMTHPDSLEYDAEGPHLELQIDPELSIFFSEREHANQPLLVRMYLGSEAKKEVISRDTDIMTPQEQITHRKELDEAIISEYKTWDKYSCFKMVERRHAPLIIDSRMVLKWKYIEGKRGIRARMALRGFKEPVKDGEQTFAGTAQRLSQRILASAAATEPDWVFGAADVPKAFLQGLTFDELEELTNEPKKSIAFTIPKGTAKHLRCVPGYEQFDENKHVLACLKPGTGCRDAPRAFSLRLMKLLRQFGMQSTLYDNQLMLLFKAETLVLVISIHVDDIKFTGVRKEVDKLMQLLEATFGKLTAQYDKFTNCGTTHERQADGSIEMHQDEYISAFKTIHPKHYQGYDRDALCNEHQQALFMSLLGAVAYTSLTQPWVLVYIVSLQRRNKQATISDLKRLNALTRELMRRPQRLRYESMEDLSILEIYSDSAFSREGESAHSLKGMVCLRLGKNKHGRLTSHLIESLSQSHKLVVRSTYAAELLAATSAMDVAFGIALTLHEFKQGCLNAWRAREIREQGGLKILVRLYLDAMSVYHSVTQENHKSPSEKSLMSHVAWLKQMLSLRLLTSIGWVDTRDMCADGLTKGKIDRAALLECMKGTFERKHAVKIHPPQQS